MRRDMRNEEPMRPREPRTTDEARRAIDDTRNRIARDMDVIEDRLVQQKDRIVEKKDRLMAQARRLEPARDAVRERPWTSVGAALGTGLFLGLITGGDEEETGHDTAREHRRESEPRGRPHRQHADASQRQPERGAIRDVGGRVTGSLGGAILSGLAARARRMGREVLFGRR